MELQKILYVVLTVSQTHLFQNQCSFMKWRSINDTIFIPHISTNMLYYLLDQYISYLKQISYDIANVIFLQSLQYLPMPILTWLTEKTCKKCDTSSASEIGPWLARKHRPPGAIHKSSGIHGIHSGEHQIKVKVSLLNPVTPDYWRFGKSRAQGSLTIGAPPHTNPPTKSVHATQLKQPLPRSNIPLEISKNGDTWTMFGFPNQLSRTNNDWYFTQHGGNRSPRAIRMQF
jgi:hypothetical protein